MTPDARPPVEEVIIAMAIERVGKLAGPELSVMLGNLWSDHRTVHVQPPYTMPSEFPLPPAGNTIPFQFALSTLQQNRYWFESNNESEVIQIQPDYIALNWRYRNEVPYPGHDALLARFLELINTLNNNDEIHIKPLAVELTYLNILDQMHVTAGDLTILPQDSSGLTINNIGVYRDLVFEGNFIGRTHATLNRGYNADKQAVNYLLNLTSRSATLDDPLDSNNPLAPAIAFIDLAHSQLLDIFTALLTPQAQEKWELR